ncbi:MAG: hypothetical protein QOI01_6805 [Mycobacterium sp.]|jgi:hypothetical protein|nr:hypothetical protein [Mycobacterium sp.]
MSESSVSALLQRLSTAACAESRAAAQRLVAIADLVELRVAEDGGASDDWVVDVVDAVTVEVSAALNISRGLAASHLRYAHALRHQLPKVGQTFIDGDIDEATFRALVFRTGLIVDDEVLARVDAEFVLRAPRWGTMNRSQLAARIDKVVAGADLDAVRRRRDRVAERDVFVGDVDNGLAEITATVYAPDGHAFADRLTELAGTVCDDDGRTMAERRSDAIGALAAGQDRLGCRCGQIDCPAGGRTASAVVIHVIAEQATIEGTSLSPAATLGYEGLIPAELIADLAKTARLRPLIHPGDAPAESAYTPSRALADFVRARDLTCRAPGCNQPATGCDLDHTIPHGRGGPTHASNLKCLCRFHHLWKTFWGWHDEQLRDGTVIWTSPSGEKYVTHPGSALIFPDLCTPTSPVAVTPGTGEPCGDKTTKMPRRTQTRARQRAADITAERHANHQMRTAPKEKTRYDEHIEYDDTFTTATDSDPPPF